MTDDHSRNACAAPEGHAFGAILPTLGSRTQVMGILNVTPDSFSDGGLFADADAALAHALALVEGGADLIDIGGESTRPGHEAVSAEEEIRRVLPVLDRLAAHGFATPISIDTSKSRVACAALAAGARIVNDVWGLQRDPEIAAVAADHGAAVVAMHNRETIDPRIDIVDDMRRSFDRSVAIARRAGMSDDRIALDPGIGFGKSWAQLREGIRRLPEIKALGFPVLVGVSRKSLLGPEHDRSVAPRNRLYGSLAALVAAIHGGADILRVHDVTASREACRVADAVLGRGRPTLP